MYDEFRAAAQLPNFSRYAKTNAGQLSFFARCTAENCKKEARFLRIERAQNWKCGGCLIRRAPFEFWFYRACLDAADRKIEMSLTLSDYQLFSRADSCFYCHERFFRQSHRPANKRGSYSHFMDRIDPSKGYSKKNIVSCCGVCNLRRGRYLSVKDSLVLGRAKTYGIKAAARVMSAPQEKIDALLALWQKTIWASKPRKAPFGLHMEWGRAKC